MKSIRCSITLCLLVMSLCGPRIGNSEAAQKEPGRKKETTTMDRLPEPKIEQIRRIRTAKDWPNPIVVVNSDSFYLILYVDGRQVQEELGLADLERKLMALGIERWSLGRVVAVQENGLRSPGEDEKIFLKCEEVKRMLEQHKIMVELWPSA
ncbi:MAG: hypothetical protein ABR555_11275 [Pyrinomonadaceae bacterium]